MESRFACFYLTGQLESILRKFQLAGVVLVVSKPHVINLTGQLVSKPPKFPTLAATDWRSEVLGPMFLQRSLGTFFGTRTDDSKTQLRSFPQKSPLFFQLGSFFSAYTMPKRVKSCNWT